MTINVTPEIVTKMAYNFTGLLMNAIDFMATQKRMLYCKPYRLRERPKINTTPKELIRFFLKRIPDVKVKHMQNIFHECTILRKKEARDAIGTNGKYRWLDIIVYARKNILPTKLETLEPIAQFYTLIGCSEMEDSVVIELIDPVSNSRHLLISEQNKSIELFSESFVYYMLNEEIVPRLFASYSNPNDEYANTSFGIGCTAINDFNVRCYGISLPAKA